MNENFYGAINDIFYGNTTDVYVYLKASQTKGANFDPERQAGYITTTQNPIIVKAIVRSVSAERMVLKEMGEYISDSLELLIKSKDIDTIKLSERIVVRGEDYYKYHDAIGEKLMIWRRPFGYYRVWIFRKEK